MNFGNEITRWYHKNKRELPWRSSKDPYLIWISEIILQQTRVDQGLAYYHRFLQKFPDIRQLAKAKEDDVLKIWQGLGYYSRARNMHHAAKEIVSKYAGKFPEDATQLRSLKGIGDYTSAAILSFAFEKKFPVVDGNVFRLLSRYFGIKTPINSSKAKKEFTELAESLMEDHLPSDFNQAIMEFGALQCKPANPDCQLCPLRFSCYAFEKKKVKALPVKNQKAKIKNRYFHYLVIKDQKKIALKKRTGNDIWKNLYDFPVIEADKKMSPAKITAGKPWKEFFGRNKTIISSASTWHKHLLSHQHIHAVFYEITLSEQKKSKKQVRFTFVNKRQLKKFAVPKLIENYLLKGMPGKGS